MDFLETMRSLFGYDPAAGETLGQNGLPPTSAPAPQAEPLTHEAVDPSTPSPQGRVLATLPRNGAPPPGVLERLNPQRGPLDGLGGDVTAGLGAFHPGMGAVGNFAAGLAGAMKHREDMDAADQKNALDTYRTLFDIQDRSAARAEAQRQHDLQQQHLNAQMDETKRYHDILGDYYGAKSGSVSSGHDKIGVIGQGPFGPKYGYVSGPNAGKSVEEVQQGGGAAPMSAPGGSGLTLQPQKTQFAPGAEGGQPQRPQQTDWEHIDFGARGDDFLSQLSEADSNLVKAIAEGRQSFPKLSRNANMNRALLAAVQAYDPTADENTIKARNTTYQEFSSNMPNRAGGMIRAGATAMAHLGELSEAAEKLGNVDMATWNKVRQAVESETGGNVPASLQKILGIDPQRAKALADYVTAQDVFAKEAEKFYRGTGGSESGIHGLKEKLDPTLPPNMIRQKIKENAALLQGQFQSLEDRWRDTMGPNVAPYPVVKGRTRKIFDTIYSRAGEQSPYAPQAAPAAGGGVAPAPTAAPPSTTTPRGGGATPSGGRVAPTSGMAEPASQGDFPTPDQKHINGLRSNPHRREEFDRKFGPGAAEKYLGPARRSNDVMAENG